MKARWLWLACALAACSEAKSQSEADTYGETSYEVFEAYLSPQQEGAEETDQPPGTSAELRGQPPYTPRDKRTSRGFGRISFAKNLSKAHIDMQIKGLDPDDIVMMHIHCGPPNFLGPIIMNFESVKGYDEDKGIASLFHDGVLSVDIDNSNINQPGTPDPWHPAQPEACPVLPGTTANVTTIGGLEYLARAGNLYFNVHTTHHVYYGEMRGQIHAVEADEP